jgi:SCP-2 sterol transfer family
VSGASGGPGGLVTLVVGEIGRSSSRSRRAPPAGAVAKAAPPELAQWSCRWSDRGPGPVSPGCDSEPDLTLSITPGDAQTLRDGRLAPSVAFMQGRLKTSGDNALLLRVLAWSATDAFAEALGQLA